MVSISIADALRCGSIPLNRWSDLVGRTWYQKLMTPAWVCCTGLTNNLVCYINAYLVAGPYNLCCSQALFAIHKPGPWWHGNWGLFKHLGLPASNMQSSAGSSGHLPHRNSHFWRRFDWCHQPWSCAVSDKNKQVVVLSRPHRHTDPAFDAFDWGFTPIKRHPYDLQQRLHLFL